MHEWLLVVFTATQWFSSSFSEGGFKTESACNKAAATVIERLDRTEKVMEQKATGPNYHLYNPRKWDFVCAPISKQ